VAAALVLTMAITARAFRWQLLFSPHHDLSRMRLFAVLNIGYLLINILPARVGELARAYLIGRGGQVSAAYALSTIVMERIYDTLVVVLLLTAVGSFAPMPRWAVQGGLVVGAATLVLAALLYVLAGQCGWLLGLWRWVTERVRWLERPGLEKGFRSALEGLAVLGRGEVALGVLGWSVVVWACGLAAFYLVMRALALDLPWSAAGLVVAVTSLSMIIPSSPGYVGVFEEGVVLSLSLFDVERETALAYALLVHALIYAIPSLWGLIGLWQESLSISALRHQLGREV